MTVATTRGRSTVPLSMGSCPGRLAHSGKGGYFSLAAQVQSNSTNETFEF
jgi:hypothetical protein